MSGKQSLIRKYIAALSAVFFVALVPDSSLAGSTGLFAKTAEKQPLDEDGGAVERTARFFLKAHKTTIFGKTYLLHFLPIAYFEPRTGLNLGFNAQLFYGPKDAYLYKARLQIISSLRGSHKHKFVFHYPGLWHSNFGLVLRAEWDRDLQARYFGIGNNSVNREDLTRSGSQNFVHGDYYLYTLKHPKLSVHLTYGIFHNVELWLGGEIDGAEPQLQNDFDQSFLGLDRPFGYLGGSGKNLSFRLSWDTRGAGVYPLGGFLNEFSFEPNFASVNVEEQTPEGPKERSKNVSFNRYTVSHAHFIPVSNRLTLANRVAFETISGEAPYYAFGEFSGRRPTRSIGGSQSLRGFQSRRFQDKVRLITLSELRFNYRPITVMSQSLGVIFIAFFDTGRVWNKISDVTFDGFHSTVGFGVWFNLNNSLIVRVDLGHSAEETLLPFFRLNTSF